MNADEPKNTQLRSAFGQLDAQSVLVHGLQRPRPQDFADFECIPDNTSRGGASSLTFLEYICVRWHLFAAEFSPRSPYSIFSGGRSLPPANPRWCGKHGHGAFRSLRARWHGIDGAQALQGVRKNGLDTWVFDARCRFKREPTPPVGGALSRSKQVASGKVGGARGYRDPSDTGMKARHFGFTVRESA